MSDDSPPRMPHVGHSTGANIFAAVKLAARFSKGEGGCLVTSPAIAGNRYFHPLSGNAATSGAYSQPSRFEARMRRRKSYSSHGYPDRWPGV